jgi:outer membrane protein
MNRRRQWFTMAALGLSLGIGSSMGTSAVYAVDQTQLADELLLSIDDAVRLAMERSLDLRAAQHGLVEAQKRVSEEWGSVMPSITASAIYARNISPAVSFVPARVFDATAPEGEFISLQFGADNSWQSALTMEQTLFNASVLVALRAAEKFEQLAVETVRGRSHEVATRVRILCYDLLLRTEEARLAQSSIERVQQALKETQAQCAAGMATSYDVLRLQVELANIEPIILRAVNGMKAARRQLAVELDLEVSSRLKLRSDEVLTDTMQLAAAVISIDSVDVLVRQSLADRSEIRQLKDTASLRKIQVRNEQADYLPTVSLFGSWDVQAQQNGGPQFFGDRNSRATSKIAGVRMELPLFTGLQRPSRIAQRKAVQRQAQTQLQVAQDRAAAEVHDLVEALNEAAARERGQRLAISHANQGYQITLARYRRGVGSRLEMTDAEVALRQSEFNHAQAAHDLLSTRVRLDFALGQVGPQDE